MLLDDQDIYAPGTDVVELRQRVGMVFQRPNRFRSRSMTTSPLARACWAGSRDNLDEIVEQSLRGADLWDEVKDNLRQDALEPVAGPAAAPVHRPGHRRQARGDPDGRALLGAGPDRHAADRGPDARADRSSYTIVIVTHNMQQAARVSDWTAFFLTDDGRTGKLVEYGATGRIFTQPSDQRTEDYITGRFG